MYGYDHHHPFPFPKEDGVYVAMTTTARPRCQKGNKVSGHGHNNFVLLPEVSSIALEIATLVQKINRPCDGVILYWNLENIETPPPPPIHKVGREG